MAASPFIRFGTAALVLALALGGCGGGSKHAANNPANTTRNNTYQQNGGTGGGNPGSMNGAATTADTGSPDMNCGAVKAVWVNPRSHVYHEPGDPYYGHTKHGKYMCPSAAKSAGYHESRSAHSDTSQ